MSELGMGAVGMDSASSMLGFIGAQQGKKQNRALRGISDKERAQQHQFQDNELAQGQQDVNRTAYYEQQNNQGQAEGRGVLHSSIPQADANNIEGERQRRYNSIQRQRSFGDTQFQNQSDMIFHQRKAQDIQNTIGMMQGMLGGGAQGGAGAYSQQQY